MQKGDSRMSKTKKEKNFEFFNQKLDDLLKDVAYAGKYVVINDQQIKAVFDTFSLALEYAVANLPEDDFVIQQVLGQNDQINFIRSAI